MIEKIEDKLYICRDMKEVIMVVEYYKKSGYQWSEGPNRPFKFCFYHQTKLPSQLHTFPVYFLSILEKIADGFVFDKKFHFLDQNEIKDINLTTNIFIEASSLLRKQKLKKIGL